MGELLKMYGSNWEAIQAAKVNPEINGLITIIEMFGHPMLFQNSVQVIELS